MKKFLIFLTILFSFIFVDNVNASDLGISPEIPLEYINYYNLRNMTEEEINEKFGNYNSYFVDVINYTKNYAENYLSTHPEVNDYIISYYEGGSIDNYIYFYNTNELINNYIDSYLYKYTSSSTEHYLNLLHIFNNNYYGIVRIKYNSSTGKPVVDYNSTSSTSKNAPLIINNRHSLLYYKKGVYNDALNKDIIFDTSLEFRLSSLGNDIYTSSSTFTQNYYSTLVISDNELCHNFNLGDTIFSNNININSEPTLNYKTGFNSNTEYEEEIGKVSIEYDVNNENSIKINEYSLFKLQYGANDFRSENIPIFSHFKIYEKQYNSNEWKDITGKNYIKFSTEETTFDYVEGTLADASISLKLKYNYEDFSLSDTELLNSEFRIDFYLENTQNSYIYVYDCLDNSIWSDSPKFLEDYVYTYFPSNYKYAFIYKSDSNMNEGKVYFPTNSIENGLINLKGQYYNKNSKLYSKPIEAILYKNNDYYSYYDFECDTNEEFFVLTRSMGSATYQDFYSKNVNDSFLNFVDNVFFNRGIYYLNKKSEDTYFYIPIGYNVKFSNGNNISVEINDEFIDLDIEDSNNHYYEIPTINGNGQVNDFSDVFDILTNEQNIKLSLFDLPKQVYENFKNSKLGAYFLIIMSTSIIILFIRSGKK